MDVNQFFNYLQAKPLTHIPMVSLEKDCSYTTPIVGFKLDFSNEGIGVKICIFAGDEKNDKRAMNVNSLNMFISGFVEQFHSVEIYFNYKSNEFQSAPFRQWTIAE